MYCKSCVPEEEATSQEDPLKYTCSICHKVFNDYVAMCRHHRKVHKGKRSLSSMFGGVRSPSAGSDSRSQSPAPDACKKHLEYISSTPANSAQDSVCLCDTPQDDMCKMDIS
ncbi:hypothetical protein L9F63_015728, partial [Diploptera punctata]